MVTTRGGIGLWSSWSIEKKRKITLSFTSPEKDFFFIFMMWLCSKKKKNTSDNTTPSIATFFGIQPFPEIRVQNTHGSLWRSYFFLKERGLCHVLIIASAVNTFSELVEWRITLYRLLFIGGSGLLWHWLGNGRAQHPSRSLRLPELNLPSFLPWHPLLPPWPDRRENSPQSMIKQQWESERESIIGVSGAR